MRTLRHRSALYLLCLSFTAISTRAATIATLPATGITTNSAILNGTVNPAGQPAFGYFVYGTTTNSETNITSCQNLGSGTSATNFSQLITGLAGGTFYIFQAYAGSGLGTILVGDYVSFFVPAPPFVTTLAATSIHPGEATLNATINPNSVPTIYWFQHGPTPALGNFTPTNALAAGVNVVAVSNLVTDLPRGSLYYFSVVASNAFGESAGSVMSFTVPQGPTGPSGTTGGGQPITLGQPTLELNYLICTNGIFPEGGGNIGVPFLGEICLFAGNFAPAGWALCQGQSVNISNNTALFDLIGTDYGGDGATYFVLPDLRGRAAIEVGQGAGLEPYVIGQQAAFTQITLLVTEIPAHIHSLPPPDSVTGATGGGQPRENRRAYLTVPYVMPLAGIYPIQGSSPIFEPFLGQILLSADARPPGSAVNGQTLAITQNEALYSLLGTNFGGNGTQNFQLPDLQSRVPLGTGQGPITDWSLAQQTGVESVTMTQEQMPAHQHTVPSLGIVTGLTGSNQPQTLMQPSLALQFLICTNGQVPSTTVEATNAMIGEIEIYAGTNVPIGWLACDGSLLNVSSCPALFGVISNFFGGDGVTTFALPNLSGRTPIGSMTGQPGATNGAEQFVLSVAQLPPHTHTAPVLDFDRWITSFGLNGNLAGFAADADSDGEENGYEWATGSNPTNAQSLAPLTIHSTSGNALVGFPRNTNATDVIFTLLRSTNPVTPGDWTGIATNVAGAWNPSAIVTETGATNPVNVSISDPLTNAPAANYRLEITWP